MNTTLDPRLHAFRTDLAEADLAGRVDAARFTAGEPRSVRVAVADLRCKPTAEGGIDTQLLFGEPVTCFDAAGDLAWVKSARDGYVGYVAAEALGERLPEATHEVAALRTFVYPEPDMKTPVLHGLSMTSTVHVTAERSGYGELAGGGWVFLAHLAPQGSTEPDPVETALRFLGLPYRWGGRSSVGLDCSALVQMVLQRSGHACPRDSDQQSASVGAVAEADEPVRRGDLLFFPGHVALALNAGTVVHATAHTMQVCMEPLAAVVARIEAESGRGLTAHRRLST